MLRVFLNICPIALHSLKSHARLPWPLVALLFSLAPPLLLHTHTGNLQYGHFDRPKRPDPRENLAAVRSSLCLRHRAHTQRFSLGPEVYPRMQCIKYALLTFAPVRRQPDGLLALWDIHHAAVYVVPFTHFVILMLPTQIATVSPTAVIHGS